MTRLLDALSLGQPLTRLGEEDADSAWGTHIHLFGGLPVEEAGSAGTVPGRGLPELEGRTGLAPRRPGEITRTRETLFPRTAHEE
jgi:hypothetical protein